ncbi:hypothetical protein [Hansschlegelia sp.]|uniref:hypothetical protein n=1 Tax=Hansschlegelia sp. TaxID=2041892 RepID=UPI002BEBD022|nr:hypothetical protein [Hansschlegelia sp.]HVI28285.1 hypothetical protein [Hansschlegelia sp.]
MRTFAAVLLLSLAAATARAESGRSGAWTYNFEPESHGGGIVTALSPAPGASFNDPSYLVARCLGGRTEFLVGTSGGWGLSGRTLDVLAQPEGTPGPPATARWDVSSNGKAVFAPEPVDALLRSLPDPGRLRIAVTDGMGQSHETIFDMTGFAEIRRRIAEACRWAP